MITRQQARELLESDDLIGLGAKANNVRTQVSPTNIISYSFVPSDHRLKIQFSSLEEIDDCLDRLESARHKLQTSPEMVAIEPCFDGSAAEYLKLLAVSRIFCNTVPNVQTSASLGLKICQIALKFGANDINGAEGETLRATEEDIRRVIRDAGYVPKQRDARFRLYSLL